MNYILRKNAGKGLWCLLLLPICLLCTGVHLVSYLHLFLALMLILCTLANILQEIEYIKLQCSQYKSLFINAIISILTSAILCCIFSLDILTTFMTCLLATYYYNYLVSNLLSKCPGSFTLGEVHIVCQGILLFLLTSFHLFITQGKIANNLTSGLHDIPKTVTCLQVLVLGCLILSHSLLLFPVIRNGISFLLFCSVLSVLMMLIWEKLLEKNVFMWIWLFCLHNKHRVLLIIVWIALSISSAIFVLVVNQMSIDVHTVTRKYFHLIVIGAFTPAVFLDLQLLRFATGITLVFFILLEIARLVKLPLVGYCVENAFQIFLDDKDSGLLILTHIYLLIGCCFPIWMPFPKPDLHICLWSGIISIGFGDTAAAICGKNFGKHHWNESKKTYEGSTCGLVIQLVFSVSLLYIMHNFTYYNIIVVILASMCATLLEAKTTQVDNLVLPLFMYIILTFVH